MQNSLISSLNQNLATAIDLKLQTKQAHWNVKGSNFIALHQLFDAIATEVEGYVDILAERVVQLGGIASGRVQDVQAASTLATYPENIQKSELHVKALTQSLSSYIAGTTALLEEAEQLGDAVTVDLLTGIIAGLDKQRWFVEAHIA